jgi:hypothetical protein
MREALLLDLGALVYELHRHSRREPELLQAKAAELTAVDQEVRGLAEALDADDSVLTLVAAGIAGSCESCGSLLSTDARYCGACGAPAVPAIGGPAPAPAGQALGGPAAREPAEMEPGPEPEAQPEARTPQPDPEPQPEVGMDSSVADEDMPEPEPQPEPEAQTLIERPPAGAAADPSPSIHDRPYADEPADLGDEGEDTDDDEPIAPWLADAEPLSAERRSDG